MSQVEAFLRFIESHIVSLLFAMLFVSILIQAIKMNVGNGEYEKFRLAHMIMKKDGTLDRKSLRETLLFFVSLYGFVHVMHKYPDQIINYFWVMAVIWLGAHVAADKLPNLGVPKTPPDQEGEGNSK